MSFLDTFDGLTDPAARTALFFNALRTDWRSLFAELRETRPVLDLPVMMVVSRWSDVVDLLSRNETFRVTYAPHMDPSVGPFMLARDGAVENWRDKSAMRTLLRWDDLPAIRAPRPRQRPPRWAPPRKAPAACSTSSRPSRGLSR